MGNYFDQFDAAPSGSAPAPGALETAQAPPMPPAPQGANGPAWRSAMTADTAKATNTVVAKAAASRESLAELDKLGDLYAKAPEEAFGSWQGSDIYNNWVRSPYSKIAPGETPLLEWHQALNEQRNKVAVPQIKLELGGVPRGVAGENSPSQMALSIIPSTESPSKQAALNGIDRARESYYTDQVNAIKTGGLRPQDVLPRADPKSTDKPMDTNGRPIKPGMAYISPAWDGKSPITPDLIKRFPVGMPPPLYTTGR